MLSAWLASGKRPAETSATESETDKRGRTSQNEQEAVTLKLKEFSKTKADVWLDSPEFSDQCLEVRSTCVFCLACNTKIGHGARYLRQHCFGNQNKSARSAFQGQTDEEKLTLRHYKLSVRWKENQRKQAVLEKAIALERQRVFAEAQKSLLPRTSLYDDEIAARVLVFETLAGAGIPMSKLDDKDFLHLIQKDGPRLGGRQGVLEVMPFVAERHKEMISKAINGRMVSLFCDGSKANFLVEGDLVRFVSDRGEIVHLCIGLTRVDRSLDGQQLRALVQHHLDSNLIQKRQVACMTTDSAAVNKVMGKCFNWDVRGFDEGLRFENSIPLHHCFPHMLSNCGGKFREAMPISLQLLSGLKGLRVSDSAKALFRELTDTALPDGTENRWFYWVEYVNAVLPHWQKLPMFVRRCKDAGYMPKKVSKMLFLIAPNAEHDVLRAGLELLFVRQLGTSLASTCYFLEGDGFLAPFTFSRLQSLNETFTRVASLDDSDANEYILAMRNFATSSRVNPNTAEAVVQKVWNCRMALVNYWRENVWEGMKSDIAIFKGFSVLDPIHVTILPRDEIVRRLNLLLQKEEIIGQGTSSAFRRVLGVKYFSDQVMTGLFGQLDEFLRLAKLFVPILSLVQPAEQPAKLWEWWWGLKGEKGVSDWAMLAQIAVLHQPSSAAIERFFSVFKGMTSEQQVKEGEKTSLVRAQLKFNKGKLTLDGPAGTKK